MNFKSGYIIELNDRQLFITSIDDIFIHYYLISSNLSAFSYLDQLKNHKIISTILADE